MGKILVLLQIAVRNLFASFLNVIIGGIILVGTLLVVLGSSLLDSMDEAMSKSVTGSVAGNVQLYSSQSKDELSLFGNMGGEDPDLSSIDDFPKVKQTLEALPEVKTVIPMGIKGALITSGNTIDLTLEKLRAAVNALKENGDSSERKLAVE